MSLSHKTKNALAIALTSQDAANEVDSALGQDGSLTPTFTTVTTTGNATIGGNLAANGNVDIASGKVLKVNNIQVVGAQQAAPTLVAVTFTAAAPANYASPTGSLTIATGAVPTVVELVEYCNELRGSINNILTALAAHGLIV